MILIQWHFCLYFFLIFLSYQTSAVYSIQCCTGDDNTCSSKPVECPSNICFKLVINKVTEERGCLDDLIKLLNFDDKNNRKSVHGDSLTSGSSNDQCHKLGTYGMSLCRCTNHLCNLTSKQIDFNKVCLILFLQFFLLFFLL
ncbi:unnamed protein product [Adineta ricciae]|uniref:Uncharacterized protein n=1 Tax=Adineta ricciae TaxID=249248 RepID=A0A815GSS7_ADIRI|nr:unnamed protein product [Adineta ricciae]CAF1342935.1 unnamed protein product [Adineta ricciae]